jgi:hypothetical protein
MGEFRLGQIPKWMTSADFQHFQLPETRRGVGRQVRLDVDLGHQRDLLGGLAKIIHRLFRTLRELTHRITEMTDSVVPGRVRTRQPSRPTRRRVKTIRLHFPLCSSIDRWITSSTAQPIESRTLKISIYDNGRSATLSHTTWIPPMS